MPPYPLRLPVRHYLTDLAQPPVDLTIMWDLEESGFVLHNLGECYLCRGWWEHYAQHSREADPSLLTAIRRRDRPLEEAKDVADTIAQRDRAIAELRERVNEKDATITEMRRNEERMKEDLGDAHDDLTSAELQIENLEDRLKALGSRLPRPRKSPRKSPRRTRTPECVIVSDSETPPPTASLPPGHLAGPSRVA